MIWLDWDSEFSALQLLLGGVDEGQHVFQRHVPLYVVGWRQDEIALTAVLEELDGFGPHILNTAVR